MIYTIKAGDTELGKATIKKQLPTIKISVFIFYPLHHQIN